jgi:hypothetical protein
MSQAKKKQRVNHTIVRDGVTLWRCNPCDDHHPKESFSSTGLKEKRCKIAQKKRNETNNCVKCKKVRASYGLSGKATHCKSCKTTEMEDVVHNRCNCSEAKQASFALPGDPPSCCKSCKQPGMVNVVSNRCNCPEARIPTFALPGDPPSCCKSCKQPGMIDVVNKRCAYIDEENDRRQCDKQARDGTDYCLEHDGGKKCERDGCGVVVYHKDKEKRFCYKHYHEFHGTENPKYLKIKEKAFNKALVENFKQLKFSCNKYLHFANFKPDWYSLLRLFHLIIELDQGQHKDYSEEEERNRIKSIVDNLPDDRPLVLIRINPDCYTNSKDELVRGIWLNSSKATGFREDEFNRRFNLLVKTIQGFLDLTEAPKQKLTEIKLFFDEFEF